MHDDHVQGILFNQSHFVDLTPNARHSRRAQGGAQRSGLRSRIQSGELAKRLHTWREEQPRPAASKRRIKLLDRFL